LPTSGPIGVSAFINGTGIAHPAGPQADDSSCALCHKSNGTFPLADIDLSHFPVTPPNPGNALLLGQSNANTNAAWIASGASVGRLPPGAIAPARGGLMYPGFLHWRGQREHCGHAAAVVIRARRTENGIVMRAHQNDLRRRTADFRFDVVTSAAVQVVAVAPRMQPDAGKRFLDETAGREQLSITRHVALADAAAELFDIGA